MSLGCKMSQLSISELDPKWVEFTNTKGVLRVLKPIEDPNNGRAQGMIFQCPRCHNTKKSHYCIFLFDNAREGARPLGRFAPARLAPPLPGNLLPLAKQSLYELPNDPRASFYLLRPRDLACKWEGYLVQGMVSWRPNFFERWR